MIPVVKKYTNKELDECRFLHLIISTTGLENPHKECIIDEANSCPICKAGRKINFPFRISKNTMRMKKIDHNGRYGFLVFDKDIVQEIKDAGFSGIEFYDLEIGKNKIDFKVADIISELPQMSTKSVVLKHQICTLCGRSGHYSNYDKVDEFWYYKKDLENADKDFYKTWEYFGIWDLGENHQSIIISQRVRQVLKRFKLKHLKYEPIFEQ